MKLKLKVRKLDLCIILLWIALFQFYLPNENIFYVYQFATACFIFIESFPVIKKNPNYLLIFLYPLTIVISCIVNRNTILYTQVIRGFTNALLIADVFLMIKRYEKKCGAKRLFEILYNMSKLYAFMNVFWIIILIATNNLQKAILNEFLFSRGKFPTAYILLFYLMFFCMVWRGNCYFPKRWKKKLFIILAIGGIGICALIQTSTGIIAILAFLILILFGKRLIRIIETPFMIVGLIIASMFLIFGLSVILRLPFVQNIIVNILHEDLSLTGRMELYTLLYPLVMKSGLWGGGFGSYVAATLAYHGWYNAQNGLAEIILKYGFVGGVTFLLLVFISVIIDKSKNIMIYLTILVFIIVAIVEVPFNNGFILLLSLLQVQDDNKVYFFDGGNR